MRREEVENEMKKLSLVVLLIAIAATALSVYKLQGNGGLTSSPWTKEKPLQNLSRVAEAAAPSIVAIGASKQEVLRLSPEGVIETELTHAGLAGNSRRDFTEVVVDGASGLVVLDTVLDTYGLMVTSEQIIRYDENGKSPQVLYELQGNGLSKRIGQIKGLQIQGETLYFYIISPEKISLMQLPLTEGKPTEAFSCSLPADR
jgi:hypothetical protein